MDKFYLGFACILLWVGTSLVCEGYIIVSFVLLFAAIAALVKGGAADSESSDETA